MFAISLISTLPDGSPPRAMMTFRASSYPCSIAFLMLPMPKPNTRCAGACRPASIGASERKMRASMEKSPCIRPCCSRLCTRALRSNISAPPMLIAPMPTNAAMMLRARFHRISITAHSSSAITVSIRMRTPTPMHAEPKANTSTSRANDLRLVSQNRGNSTPNMCMPM